MKVRNKLILAFLIPIIAIGLLSVIIQLWNKALFQESFQVSTKKLEIINNLEYLSAESSRNLLVYTLLQTSDERKAYQNNISTLLQNISELKTLPLSDVARKSVLELEKNINEMIGIENKLFEIADQRLENIKKGRDLLYNKLEPLLSNQWLTRLRSGNSNSQEKQIELLAIEVNINRVMSGMRGYMLYHAPELRKLIEENITQANFNVEKFSKLNLDQQELFWLSQLTTYIQEIEKLLKTNLLVEDNKNKLIAQSEIIENNIRNILHSQLEQLAKTNLLQNFTTINKINNMFIVVMLASILISFIIAFMFTNYLIRPVEYLRYAIEQIRKGDNIKIKRQSDDEIGEVTDAFASMVKENRQHTKTMSEQNWLIQHVNEILKLAQASTQLDKMCNAVIQRIAEILNAGSAAFYITKEEKNNKFVELHGSYAYKRRKSVSNKFNFGEGLVGQAALENQAIILSNVPEDYLNIKSGLGEKKPAFLALYPITLEEKTLGVIEIATFKDLSEIETQLLEQLALNLATVIEAIQNKQATDKALIQIKEQAEILQTQQEELRAANEELEEKTHSLQQSEEELKTQSEELQATNSELEEQMQAIERQKKEIEQKNKALKEIQLALEDKAKSLAQAGKYKSEFLSNMSHELRTPLNSLLLLAKAFAQNTDGNLTPQQIEEANIIYRGGKDLLTLINDILDLSKVEAGKLTIQMDNCKFSDLVEDLSRQFTPIVTNKGITFNCEIQVKEESIYTDAHRLKQILRNLISNAIKFTEQGSVKLIISYGNQKIQDSKDNKVVFSVIDTGIGIAKEKHAEIFEAFQQAYGDTDRKYGGTGLGLTISRELAKLLGGEIKLESEEGKGSTFSLILPFNLKEQLQNVGEVQRDDRDVTNPATPQEISLTPNALKSPTVILKPTDQVKKVLLLGNDQSIQAQIENKLAEKNIELINISNGNEAIQQIQKHGFAGIIMDLKLSDMTGLEFLQKLTNLKIEIPPIIIYTDKELSNEEYAELNNYTDKIILKENKISIQRLIQESLLFQHPINKIASLIDKPMLYEPDKIMQNKKILIADDDMRNVYALSRILQRQGAKITAATDGEDALAKIAKETPDLIIMDIMMPVMDGFEAMKQIRKQPEYKNLPIIAVTAKAMAEDRKACLDAGANDYITKPIDDDKLLTLIRIWLSK